MIFSAPGGGFSELQIGFYSDPCRSCRSVHHPERCCHGDPVSVLVNPNVQIPYYFLPVGYRDHHWMVPAQLF
jgi:hypothetical protein